jgi:hypothetical protein
MPAVIDPHAETWPATAKAVRAAIKRRKITFALFVREIGEERFYGQTRHNIALGRPPILNRRGNRIIAKVEKWLAEHGN